MAPESFASRGPAFSRGASPRSPIKNGYGGLPAGRQLSRHATRGRTMSSNSAVKVREATAELSRGATPIFAPHVAPHVRARQLQGATRVNLLDPSRAKQI